jgi:hypothetical protein
VKQIRRHLTYANVMSSIAVFMVLGGATAIAATKIGANQLKANSVKTGKIVKEAVTAGKIKNGAVNESKLADGAVTTNKVADNAVTSLKIAKDAVTEAKIAKDAVTTEKIAKDAVTAEKIAKEVVSAEKLANGSVTAGKLAAITVQTESVVVGAGGSGSANVACPAGQRAISGGGAWDTFNKDLSYLSTRPIVSLANLNAMTDGQVPGGWRSSGTNGTGANASIQVWVLCIA